MLRHLLLFSLKYRLVVLLSAAMLMVAGLVAVREAPWDVFPEFAPPQIVVQTEAPGLSSEEVERLVTIPIEAAINGVSRIETLRSSSVPGLSVVTAIFEEGTDVLDARQLTAERLAQLGPELPASVEAPRMTPLAASTSRLIMLALTSETVSPMELRTIADWTFQRRLRGVKGVAHVEVFGGEVKQFQVLVQPDRLRRYQITLDDVLAAASDASGFGGAGYVETPNQRLPIRQRTDITSPDDLAAVPVLVEEGVALSLGTVADVQIGAADKPGDATINGKPGVLILVHKQPHFNTLDVSENVQQAIDELETALPEGVELHRTLFQQSAFIERAIENLSLGDIDQKLKPVLADLPVGYHVEIGGEHEASAKAGRRLLQLSCAALIGIFIMLYLDFRSVGLAVTVMLSVPLAGVGGIAAVLLSGGDVSLGSMVGFVTVFGIAVRNGILLISHYRHLQQEEGIAVGPELIVRGAAERLAPILMTASSTALALLPLVVRGNLPGHEIEYPMAIVIIGGLVSSTFLTLFLLPLLYQWFGWRLLPPHD